MHELREGDVVELESPLAVQVYRAAPFGAHANPWAVTPDDFCVLDPEGGSSLPTLTTGHPKSSAWQPLTTRFELDNSQPLRSAV